MNKWIIGTAPAPVAVFGVVASLPTLLSICYHCRPRPVVVVDSAMRQQAIARGRQRPAAGGAAPRFALPAE